MSAHQDKMARADRSQNATRTPQPAAGDFFVVDNVWDAVEKNRQRAEDEAVAKFVVDRWGHDTGNGGG